MQNIAFVWRPVWNFRKTVAWGGGVRFQTSSFGFPKLSQPNETRKTILCMRALVDRQEGTSRRCTTERRHWQLRQVAFWPLPLTDKRPSTLHPKPPKAFFYAVSPCFTTVKSDKMHALLRQVGLSKMQTRLTERISKHLARAGTQN